MKKIIFSILAALCLAACIEENIDTDQQLQEITFNTDFTAYVTKSGEVTQENITEFYVLGWSVHNQTKVLKQIFGKDMQGTRVYKDGNGWRHDDPKQYWFPGYTYEFWAVTPNPNDVGDFKPGADGNGYIIYDENGLPASYIISISPWGLGAMPKPDITIAQTGPMNSSSGPVELDFQHVLSKVRMSFKNNIDPNININISNITIQSHKNGNLNLDATWPSGSAFDKNDIDRFNPVNGITTDNPGETESIFVIPTGVERNISFDVTLSIPDTKANGTTTIKGSLTQALVMGKEYNLVIDITPEVIKTGETQIKVEEINGWETATYAQKFSVASKLGGTVTLTENLTLSDSFNVLDDLTINLNGKTLTYTGNTQLFNVTGTGSLTINGNDNDASSIISSGLIATAVDASSTITINGGSHTTAGPTVCQSTDGEILIVDGNFQSSTPTEIFAVTGGKIKITGGSFYNWNPETVIWDEITQANFKPIYYKPASDDVIMRDRNYWYHIKKKAVVGDANLSERVENLQDLLDNENVGGITVSGSVSATTNNQNEPYLYTIQNDVTIDFQNVQSTIKAYGYAFLIDGAIVTINNLNTNVSDGIRIRNQSDVIFNGNTISLQGSKSGGRYAFLVENSNLTIENGVINNMGSRSADRYMWIRYNSEVTINGGTWGFSNKTTPEPPIYVDSPARLYITGGSYNFSPNDISYAYEGMGEVYISGGTFTSSSKPTMHLTDGYEYVSSGTNKWTVRPIAATGN